MAIRAPRLAAVLALVVPGAALAQQEAVELSTITVTASGETATGPVDGIVATASATGTKTDTPILETPRSISVVTAAEIAQRGGAQTIGDTLGYVPGVFSMPAASNRTNWNERIRGFSNYGSGFIDGLADPTGIDRAQPQTEPFGAERVEVLKGPASVLYGQISPGGLVNVVTKRPTFGTEKMVQGQVGSFDLYQGAFDLDGVLAGDAVGWRLVGLGQSAKSQVEFAEDDRLYVAPSLAWASDTTSLTILTHYRRNTGSEADQSLPADLIDALPVGLNPGDPDFDEDDTTQWSLGYEVRHEFAPNLVLEQNARYFHLDVAYRQLYLAYPLDDRGLYARSAYLLDETITQTAVDTRLRYATTTGPLAHDLLLGVDFRDQKSDNSSWYAWGEGPTIDLFDPVYGQKVGPFEERDEAVDTIEHVGVYLQDQIAFGNWRATLGGRWDHVKTRFDIASGDDYDTETEDRHFSGNAGLLYLFDNGIAPYASWAQSFEPQSGQTWDHRPFEPTEGEQVEVGVKYQPPGVNALVTLAAFDLTQKNVVTADLVHPNEQIQTGEIRVRGVELEGRAMVGPVQATLAYTWTAAEITSANDGTEGKDWPGVPRNMASLWLDYGFEGGALRGLSLGGGVRGWSGYYGEDDTMNTAWNGGAAVLDVAMGYDFGALRPEWSGVALDLAVNNVADRRITSCSPWGCNFDEERTATATLSYTW